MGPAGFGFDAGAHLIFGDDAHRAPGTAAFPIGKQNLLPYPDPHDVGVASFLAGETEFLAYPEGCAGSAPGPGGGEVSEEKRERHSELNLSRNLSKKDLPCSDS